MNLRTFIRAATLAASAVTLLGCSDVKAPISARQDPYSPQQIHLASDDLRHHTALDAPHVWRDDGGLLHVTVPIRAATDKQLYIDYRATFFDRDRLPISEAGWTRKTLAPNVPDQFSVNSTSPLAQDFQIDIRYSK